MEAAPHRLVADAGAALGQEVGADARLVDAHRLLGAGREERLAHARPRAPDPLARAGLEALDLIEEVAVRPEGVEVRDLARAQAAFAGDDDHRVVARGRELLPVAGDVVV